MKKNQVLEKFNSLVQYRNKNRISFPHDNVDASHILFLRDVMSSAVSNRSFLNATSIIQCGVGLISKNINYQNFSCTEFYRPHQAIFEMKYHFSFHFIRTLFLSNWTPSLGNHQ